MPGAISFDEALALQVMLSRGQRREAKRVLDYLSPNLPESIVGRFPFDKPTQPLCQVQAQVEVMLAPVSPRRRRAAALAREFGMGQP